MRHTVLAVAAAGLLTGCAAATDPTAPPAPTSAAAADALWHHAIGADEDGRLRYLVRTSNHRDLETIYGAIAERLAAEPDHVFGDKPSVYLYCDNNGQPGTLMGMDTLKWRPTAGTYAVTPMLTRNPCGS